MKQNDVGKCSNARGWRRWFGNRHDWRTRAVGRVRFTMLKHYWDECEACGECREVEIDKADWPCGSYRERTISKAFLEEKLQIAEQTEEENQSEG